MSLFYLLCLYVAIQSVCYMEDLFLDDTIK